MSIADEGFELSACCLDPKRVMVSHVPASPAEIARFLCDNMPMASSATVAHTFGPITKRDSESAVVLRVPDGWVVKTAQPARPWHTQLQRLLHNQDQEVPNT